jgi:DNA-binding NarL/FixJ family response regulator
MPIVHTPHRARKRQEPRMPKLLAKKNAVTRGEKRIIDLLVEGHNNESIASQCDLALNTIRRHLSNIFPKFRVNSRLELAICVLNQRHAEELRRLLGDDPVMSSSASTPLVESFLPATPVV